MKIYNSPMLQVVSINTKDIIATSGGQKFTLKNEDLGSGTVLAPGQRSFDEWYEGY